MSGESIISCYASGAITRGLAVRISGYEGGVTQVIQSTDGTTATAHKNVGIALDTVADNGRLRVQIGGVCQFATASAAISAGVLVSCTAAGKLKAAASGDRAFGIMIAGKDSDGTSADTEECLVSLFGGAFLDVA